MHEPVEKEITGISEEFLSIAKRDGIWKYPIWRYELPLAIRQLLEQRQKEGWNPIAIAKFKEKPGTKVLLLTGVGL